MPSADGCRGTGTVPGPTWPRALRPGTGPIAGVWGRGFRVWGRGFRGLGVGCRGWVLHMKVVPLQSHTDLVVQNSAPELAPCGIWHGVYELALFATILDHKNPKC